MDARTLSSFVASFCASSRTLDDIQYDQSVHSVRPTHSITASLGQPKMNTSYSSRASPPPPDIAAGARSLVNRNIRLNILTQFNSKRIASDSLHIRKCRIKLNSCIPFDWYVAVAVDNVRSAEMFQSTEEKEQRNKQKKKKTNPTTYCTRLDAHSSHRLN